MDHGHVLRRLVHMCTPLFLVYYWIPDPLWRTNLDKRVVLVLLLVIVLIFEAIRLKPVSYTHLTLPTKRIV